VRRLRDWWPDPRRASLRERLRRDPLCRFQSAEEVALAAELGTRIEVNRAEVDDWLRLPGLSIRQARTLCDLKRAGVQFLCLDDLAAALNVPRDRLADFAPVLRFSYFDPETEPVALDPNRATVEQLAGLPGLDRATAERICERRQQAPYRDLADLARRVGLDAEAIARVLHCLQF